MAVLFNDRKPRIAVIPAIFNPALNYQENVCANALSRNGFEVAVFTSYHGLAHLGKTSDEVQSPFPVIRASKVISIGNTQIPYDGQSKVRLIEYKPDVAFLMAPLHGLGYFWMSLLPRECKVIATFSDIPWHRETRKLASWVKRRWARKIFARSDLVVSTTAQTTELLMDWGADLIKGKLRCPGLSVDFQSLASDGTLGSEASRLRSTFRTMGVMATKPTPEKKIDEFFEEIDRFLTAEPSACFVIAGVCDDPAGEAIRCRVASSPNQSRVLVCEPLTSHQLGELFSMADFSVCISVTIGIYHSLYSGCPVVIWSERGSAEHLIKDQVNGLWFKRFSEAGDRMLEATRFQWSKEMIVDSVKQANGDLIFPGLVRDVMGEENQ